MLRQLGTMKQLCLGTGQILYPTTKLLNLLVLWLMSCLISSIGQARRYSNEIFWMSQLVNILIVSLRAILSPDRSKMRSVGY